MRAPPSKRDYAATRASWLNQTELWFSILSRRLPRRGIFTSSDDLVHQILRLIENHNRTAKPFAWTYQGIGLIIIYSLYRTG